MAERYRLEDGRTLTAEEFAECTEYGNAVCGGPAEAASAMAGSLRELGDRVWVELPRLVPSPTDGRFGWYGMAKKKTKDQMRLEELEALVQKLRDVADG